MRRTLLCCWAALTTATDVTFEPGPGLKKNEDGTYSRTYDAQAEGAAADANATAAAPKKPKRSFSINDIGKKEEHITKSDLQLRAEKIFPALLNARWRLYTRLGVVLLLLYLLGRRYRPPRPRVERRRRTYIARRYWLPFVFLVITVTRHILADFSVTLTEEYLRRWNVEHGEVIKRLEADRPWTFNFSRYECRNASNATIAEKVHANKRLHKAVEAMHKQLGWANAEVAQQAVERQRLEAQFEVERAALSATLKRLAAVEDDVAGLAKALGFAEEDDEDDEGLTKSIVRRAKTAALHAAISEDLELLNETEIQTLATKKKGLEAAYNNTLKTFTPEAERRVKEKQTSMKTHIDRNPAVTFERSLNWTAVGHVLVQHARYDFKRRGWEQWCKDLWTNAPRFIPIKVYRRYTLLKSTLLWMRRGELGRSIEIRVLNATIQFNETLKEKYNFSLNDVSALMSPVGAQLAQCCDEFVIVSERWFSAFAAVVRYVYEHMREFMKPRWKRACRFLRRWDAAPPLVKKRPGYALALALSSPFVGPPVVRCVVYWPIEAVRAYLSDLRWLLGLLGFGTLMERLRRAADAVVRRFAAAVFERVPVVGSS
jgi:hypothetical protein